MIDNEKIIESILKELIEIKEIFKNYGGKK